MYLFLRVKKFFHLDQTRYGVYLLYLKSKTKGNCGIAGLEQIRFTYGKLQISRLTNVKNRSFSEGWKVLQFGSNSVWSIPCEPRFWNKRNCGIARLEIKSCLHTEICEFFRITIFKNRFLSSVLGVFQTNQTRYGVSPVQVMCNAKRIYGIACLEKS